MGLGRLGLVCFILAEILVVQAIAEKSAEGTELNPVEVKFGRRVGKLGVVARVAAAQPISSVDKEESKEAEAPEAENKIGHPYHYDRSVFCGGVIIGGLVTAIFATVYCYIRVTRRRDDVK